MLEGLQASGPEHPVVFQPAIEFAEGPWVKPVDAGAGIAALTNQSGLAEHPQGRRPPGAEQFDQFADHQRLGGLPHQRLTRSYKKV